MPKFDLIPGREYIYRDEYRVIYKRMRHRMFEFERVPDCLFMRFSCRDVDNFLREQKRPAPDEQEPAARNNRKR